MTVSEMIEILKTFPPEAAVWISDDEYGPSPVHSIQKASVHPRFGRPEVIDAVVIIE